MRIRIYSDLHLEFGVRVPADLHWNKVDLVVLAGDIHMGVEGIRWAQTVFSDQPVAYVLGNHEFYDHDFDQLIEQAHQCAQGSNVTVLENQSLEVGGLRILGCSLWTDFRAMGAELESAAQSEAARWLNDYRLISHQARRLRPSHTRDRCRASLAWLSQQIATATQPLLVVTHHVPTLATADPQHEGSLLTPSFHSAVDELIRPPVRMWVFGHTHFNADIERSGVRILSHQKGYPRERVKGFAWDRVFELEVGP